MSSEAYHEPLELLSEATRNLHRGIVSLVEELEAVDWYQQRAEACSDAELKAVLLHHRDEEIEHAMMNLEWIRRQSPAVDRHARTYLFTEASIVAIEKEKEKGEGGDQAEPDGPPRVLDGTLGVGSLRSR